MAKKTETAKRPRSAKQALSVATNARKPAEERIAAMAEAPLALCEKDDDLQAILDILSDREEPSELRLAALQSLQAASFSVLAFESCRGEYIATLRKVADDPDRELRQRVLGILAREKDGYAQKKLLEGLRDPEKALVPPEKALQLLGYDVHAEAYSVAREIVEKPPNTAARREALRLLSADADAAPMFEKILRDKNELPDVRRISAAALQTVRPERLLEHAREIVLDASEPGEIQAASLTALTQFGDAEEIAKDEALLQRVDRLGSDAPATVKKTARRFLGKYGQ